MCKCCHHTWCKFCVSFLFNSPVGLPFSVGMSQLLLLCSRLSPDVLALWPSLSVARTGQPERVVRETDGRHGAGRGAGFSVAGTTPFPAPPSRGRCRRACSSGQGAAPRDSGPFCPHCPEALAVSPGLQVGAPPPAVHPVVSKNLLCWPQEVAASPGTFTEKPRRQLERMITPA